MKTVQVFLVAIVVCIVAATPGALADGGAGLSDGIIHYWSFDPADDAHGQGRLKLIPDRVGGIPLVWVRPKGFKDEEWLAEGLVGKAVTVTPKVRVISDENLYLDESFTVSSWVNLNSSSSSHKHGVFFGDNWSLHVQNRKLVFSGGTKNIVKSTKDIPHGEWVHLAVVVSPRTKPTEKASHMAQLFINGKEEAKRSCSKPLSPEKDYFRKLKVGSNLDGTIDEMAIWSRSLSAKSILALSKLGRSGKALGERVEKKTSIK